MSSNNKRQRTTTSTDSLHINDLPDGLLVGISNYLAKPSLALFAIAISSNTSRSTQTSKAIIASTNWNALDFSDIEKSLAAKLSDDDIDKVLKSIDAVNNLQILKLAGCVNITGSGLDVLRSSTVLEQIDLSLVGKHESPILDQEPLLSEDLVIPILDSVINGAGSLKQLEFPKKWRNIEVESTQFVQFLERYNQYLTNQRYCCSKCNEMCYSRVGNDWVYRGRIYKKTFGTQNYTCSGCLKHFCRRGECGGGFWLCDTCEKRYCEECAQSAKCSQCYFYFCNKCEEMKAYPSVIIGVDPPTLCGRCCL
jgi:hypothetical protein